MERAFSQSVQQHFGDLETVEEVSEQTILITLCTTYWTGRAPPLTD